MDFLAKVRAEVDWVIFFGLGLKVKASRDIRRRMVWVFSRLGLKPKLLLGCNLRGKRNLRGRLNLRPRPLDADSQVKSNDGVFWVPSSDSGQGEVPSEPVVSAVESPGHVFLGDIVFMGSVAGSEETVLAALLGTVADSSPAKSMLWRGFLRPVSSSPPIGELSRVLQGRSHLC